MKESHLTRAYITDTSNDGFMKIKHDAMAVYVLDSIKFVSNT